MSPLIAIALLSVAPFDFGLIFCEEDAHAKSQQLIILLQTKTIAKAVYCWLFPVIPSKRRQKLFMKLHKAITWSNKPSLRLNNTKFPWIVERIQFTCSEWKINRLLIETINWTMNIKLLDNDRLWKIWDIAGIIHHKSHIYAH